MSEKIICPVITISREYGAGGRSVAKVLAEKLDLKWYDKDLVRATALSSGFSEEDINREGEEISRLDKILESLMTTNYNSSHLAIFQAQKAEILELAKEPCIIVGRCANIILREAGIPSLDIFLYADMEHKLARAAELQENGREDLEKYVETREKLRTTYYKTFTKHTPGDYHDYDLMLNTGLLGYDKCVEIIAGMIDLQNY